MCRKNRNENNGFYLHQIKKSLLPAGKFVIFLTVPLIMRWDCIGKPLFSILEKKTITNIQIKIFSWYKQCNSLF